MSDFDISDIQDLDQVEITDLDGQVDGFGNAISTGLLRFTRSMPFINEPQGKFILLIYCMCIVALLFMIQPGLPAIPEQFAGTPSHELRYPLAIYPFTIQDTSSAQNVTWIRISNGQIITLQIAPGKIAGYHCKVRHWFAPPRYVHPMIIVCT